MIYRDIEYTPYKTLIKVLETNNFRLLTDDPDVTDEELAGAWDALHKEYLALNPSNDTERIVKITREVYYHELKYELVITYCKILAFNYNEVAIADLQEFGYDVNDENYLERITVVQREAQGLLMKAKNLKKQLPVIKDDIKVSLDEVLASYSAILGIDFDYNTVTVTKVIALGKQIDLKIKSYQQNNIQNGK